MFVFKKCYYLQLGLELGVSVFNITFNNISVISWQSVLLVEETRVPRINHQLVASNLQTLSHINVGSSKPRQERDSNSQHKWWWALITQVIYNCDEHWLHRLFTTVMGTDYTGYLQLWWALITQVIYNCDGNWLYRLFTTSISTLCWMVVKQLTWTHISTW